MRPQDRENWRYTNITYDAIDIAERVMLARLPNPTNKKILDVGCGTGDVSLELQKIGFEVTGLDFSSVGVEKAKEKGINAKKCNLDKEGIPFPANYFDVIWAGDVIEHVFDPIFLLNEMNRVLKNEGTIFISTPNDINIFKRFLVFFKGSSPQSAIYRTKKICKHHTVMSCELLKFMLKEANLSCDNIGAIIKIPKIGNKRFSNNKILCSLFGYIFIVETHKV